MKKLFLFFMIVFSSFSLFAVDGDSTQLPNIIDITETITEAKQAKTTITLDTSSEDSQYIEVGFSSGEVDDFTSTIPVITDNSIVLKTLPGGSAYYGGADTDKIYAYYRVHYSGNTEISILTESLSYNDSSINTKVSGTRKDVETDGGFSTGTTDSGEYTYTAALIYEQKSGTTTPSVDSISLTIETESYLAKPSGNYTGTIILKISTDEPVIQG